MARIDPQPQPEEEKVADLGDGLELRADGTVRRGARLARPTDVAIRDDLPPSHPLYGSRALRVVPAGMTDMVISADGRLMPAIEPEPEPEPTGEVGGTPREL